MTEPPGPIDTTRPSAARMYDYGIGGSHNFEVDRQAIDAIHAAMPPGQGRHIGVENRAFLHRAVRFCLQQGVDQFLDLGSGIPTVGNVHEIAHSINPAARVVYTDIESVAVATTRRMLHDVANADIIQADIHDAESILEAPETERLLDFSRPVALLAVAVFHYVAREHDLPALLQRYRAHLVPGSVVAISHTTTDHQSQAYLEAHRRWNESGSEAMVMRTHTEVAELFEGLDLVEPGITWTSTWRPDQATGSEWPSEASACWAGVAMVPPDIVDGSRG
ncbi:SAM-dependent methyltransferase [Saccharopolyspora sp. K220]|uniref:SAM-dependent methyltransferase n=1 Tax=Saccharopolyspora soli TaxID=2926618 RepID=UPI001F56AEE8|nr:SAM-dependent methyltransferase [Saccharopolyspora soli]MCI2416783.1 SAM-dependent methyltransferase [Saccharopolyspora soli]